MSTIGPMPPAAPRRTASADDCASSPRTHAESDAERGEFGAALVIALSVAPRDATTPRGEEPSGTPHPPSAEPAEPARSEAVAKSRGEGVLEGVPWMRAGTLPGAPGSRDHGRLEGVLRQRADDALDGVPRDRSEHPAPSPRNSVVPLPATPTADRPSGLAGWTPIDPAILPLGPANGPIGEAPSVATAPIASPAAGVIAAAASAANGGAAHARTSNGRARDHEAAPRSPIAALPAALVSPSAVTIEAPATEAAAAATPAAPASQTPATTHVVLPLGGEAADGSLRLAIRGASLSATIVAPDAAAARSLEGGLGELRGALEDRGFNAARLTVRTMPADSSASAEPRNHSDDARRERDAAPRHQRNDPEPHTSRERPRRSPQERNQP